MLPNDYKARKAIPLYTYLTQYHPNALVEVAKVAVAGNEQHNPGEPMHWAKGKSMDQLNTAMRHIFDHGMGNAYDRDDPYRCESRRPIMHLAKAAWRLLAEIELLCEARDAGLNIDALVRGTHEYLKPGPYPEAPKLEDYGMDVATGPDTTVIAPMGTVDPAIPLDPPAVALPAGPLLPETPRGRLLACGCFANCAGQTPRCPAWKSPAPFLKIAVSEADMVKAYDPAEWEQPDAATLTRE